MTPRDIALDDVFKFGLNSVLGIVEKKVFNLSPNRQCSVLFI